MTARRVVAVIPARYASSRFPGKPLAPILGTPMIGHVVARSLEAGCFDEVIVATDDDRIAVAAAAAGARVAMTGEARSGTDRVAMAIRGVEASVVLNVQGDEPALPRENLRLLADFLKSHPEVPMGTLSLPGSEADQANPNVVKVVCDKNNRALYFSRAAIPFPRNGASGLIRRHVGLYGFQRETLLSFAALPECELERAEALEQLRALYHGIELRVLPAVADSVAVDVPSDVPLAEEALRALRRTGTNEGSV